MLSLRRASLVAALGLAACAAPADEAASSSEDALTRSVVTYAFTNAASLGYLQGLALGPSKDGALFLAEDYTKTGNVTKTNLWDGTKLAPTPSGPFYANGDFAYDDATKTTYFLQYSANATTAYESLFRYDASGWKQVYSRVRPAGPPVTIVFDTARKVLLRIGKDTVETLDASASTFQKPAWTDDGAGPGVIPYGAAFDEKRGVLLLLSGSAPLERTKSASGAWTWAPVSPTAITPPQPAPSTGGNVAGCRTAAFVPSLGRVVGLCDTVSRGARVVEWDGKTMQIGVLESDRAWGPKAFTFDRAHGAFVAADPDRFYTVTRTVKTMANQPPALTSKTSAEIYATEEASIPVVAADADLDAVTTTLVSGPPGASLDGNVLRWTPGVADEGKHAVKVRLGDGEASVEQTLDLDVKVLRYSALATGDVAVAKQFWISGPGTLQGQTRNMHGKVSCNLTGKNPGVVRASCGITAEYCGDPSGAGTSPCSVALGASLGAASVVSEAGAFGESRSTSRTCPSCTRWSSEVNGTFSADKGVCVSYRYETDEMSGQVLGHAVSQASGCSGP